MLFIIGVAIAGDLSVTCRAPAPVDLLEVQLLPTRKGTNGIVQRRALARDLPDGLRAELRFEHAYGATFIVLDLRRDDASVSSATAWLPGIQLDLSSPSSPADPTGAGLSLRTVVAGRTVSCSATGLPLRGSAPTDAPSTQEAAVPGPEATAHP